MNAFDYFATLSHTDDANVQAIREAAIEALGGRKVSPGGRIQDPGKFEGEAWYIPYFWDSYLNGMADDDGEYLTFDLEDDERKAFGIKRSKLRLYQTDNGFVCEA